MRVRERYELLKVVCVVVAFERDGDRIVAEREGVPIPCYSLEDLAKVYETAQSEIAQLNAAAQAQAESTAPPPDELAATATELPPGVPGGHLG